MEERSPFFGLEKKSSNRKSTPLFTKIKGALGKLFGKKKKGQPKDMASEGEYVTENNPYGKGTRRVHVVKSDAKMTKDAPVATAPKVENKASTGKVAPVVASGNMQGPKDLKKFGGANPAEYIRKMKKESPTYPDRSSVAASIVGESDRKKKLKERFKSMKNIDYPKKSMY